jgi:hypothetical protein
MQSVLLGRLRGPGGWTNEVTSPNPNDTARRRLRSRIFYAYVSVRRAHKNKREVVVMSVHAYSRSPPSYKDEHPGSDFPIIATVALGGFLLSLLAAVYASGFIQVLVDSST